MANLERTITIGIEYRPCYVNGKKALFHRWCDIRNIVPPSLMVGGHNGGEIAATLAIVEYNDGTVAEVEPTSIIFADRTFDEYAFEERKINNEN